MYYALPIHENKQIKILPDYVIKENNYTENFNGRFIIPLKSLSLNRIPVRVEIRGGNQNFNSLDDAVDFIYSQRSYTSEESKAKKLIQTKIIKALTSNSSAYSLNWSFRFDYIDAESYEVVFT